MPITLNPSFRLIPRVGGRTIVVGDIHGCFDELLVLLGQVAFGADDVLVSVGDLVDRGPKSEDVLRYFRDTPGAFSVVGNHDRRLAGSVRGTSQPAWSQRQTLNAIDRSKHADWATFLESLPAVIRTPHAIVTHARLDPERPVEQQEPYFTCAVGGASVQIELNEAGVPPWVAARARELPVCVGHVSYRAVELVSGMFYALDTGAAAGGSLTAVIFPGGRIVQVKVSRDYHGEARAAWETARQEVLPLGQWVFAEAVRVLGRAESASSNPHLAQRRREFVDLIGRWAMLSVVAVELIERRFGNVPPPGPERGTYFRWLKTGFDDRLTASVAATLATRRALDLGALASHAGRATVDEVSVALGSLLSIE